MGKPTGFKEHRRIPAPKRPVAMRLQDYSELLATWHEGDIRDQGARCMNCAVPFCHQGCPLGNLIPDWNDLVYSGEWKRALDSLHSTNNFPEFTGRICPAPCEASCVLNINQDPVTIEHIEMAVADRGWSEGWITPQPPSHRTGKSIAVVGSGPSGLAAAQQLNRCGHSVTVFERAESIGG
ncbi:MAG: NAD(P)-binding protein, partial [SAR202 cluster bacterium]|nr:NAD(P)-binding protein [SAR202 cluster bacterium]